MPLETGGKSANIAESQTELIIQFHSLLRFASVECIFDSDI